MEHIRKIRILFIHYGGSIGGAPVSIIQTAAALDRTRFEPFIAFTRPGPIRAFAGESGITSCVCKMRSVFFYGAHVRFRLRMLAGYILFYFPTIIQATRLIKKVKPDIVHLNTSVLLPAAPVVKKSGIPLVWHIREAPGSNALVSLWQVRFICKYADRIIATSGYVADSYKKYAPHAAGRISVVHNAIETARFNIDAVQTRRLIRNELHIPENALVAAMLGSVQRIKGHFLLVEAAVHVVDKLPVIRFVIVAGGAGDNYRKSWKGRIKKHFNIPFDNIERLHRLITEKSLADYFIFTGYRNDVPDLLAATDMVLFLPQAPEGFGRPLIEAMAGGKPLITTDIGPSREIAGDEAALYVPAGDAESIAASILTLASDPELRERMGMAGKRRADTLFSMEKYITTVTGIYHSLVGNRTRLE